MTGHAKTILRDVGLVLHVPGLMALVSLPVCLYFGEIEALKAFALTAAVSLGLGQALYQLCKSGQDTRLHHGMVIAAVGWFFVSLLGALPFWLLASSAAPDAPGTLLAFRSPINAIFESFSGFTGTGLTMAKHPSLLPRSLQWWRSFTQWIGGVGVIVLMLSILRPTSGAFRLYFSEGREEKIRPTVASTVRTIWRGYLFYTIASVAALVLAGLPWWEAINHAMTAIATGGFSVTDQSASAYDAPTQLVLIVIMILGAISFATHYQAYRTRHWKPFWQDAQFRAMGWFLGVGVLVLTFEYWWFEGTHRWIEVPFQWVSALTTAGFQSAELASWSPTALLLLTLAMLSGGAAGSTAGGVKLVRLVLFSKGLYWRFKRASLTPHQVMRYAFEGRGLSESQANRMVEAAAGLAVLWAVVLWMNIIALIHLVPPEFTLAEVIFEVASAQSNVGLSTGLTGPELPGGGKVILIMAMWLGRLEIIPVLILAISSFMVLRNRLLGRRR